MKFNGSVLLLILVFKCLKEQKNLSKGKFEVLLIIKIK